MYRSNSVWCNCYLGSSLGFVIILCPRVSIIPTDIYVVIFWKAQEKASTVKNILKLMYKVDRRKFYLRSNEQRTSSVFANSQWEADCASLVMALLILVRDFCMCWPRTVNKEMNKTTVLCLGGKPVGTRTGTVKQVTTIKHRRSKFWHPLEAVGIEIYNESWTRVDVLLWASGTCLLCVWDSYFEMW